MRRSIIYLDQSRVSEMVRVTLGVDPAAGGPYREAYQRLHRRLLELVGEGSAVCPFSLWHAVESILFDDDEVRRAVCSFFDAAAAGTSFRFFHDVFEGELASLGGAGARPALGDALDCFPNGVITPLTRDVLSGSARVFSTVVELLREDRQLLEGFVAHRDTMLGAVKGYVEKYHGTPASPLAPPSVSAIRSDLGRDFVRHHLRDLVADGLPMTTAEQAHRLAVTSIDSESWASAGIPGLGAWSDVFASRVHRGGKVDSTKKRRGEAFDLCHMTALAYADTFLMEKKFAGIGERAARLSGTTLVNAPDDLLMALESVGRRGSAG